MAVLLAHSSRLATGFRCVALSPQWSTSHHQLTVLLCHSHICLYLLISRASVTHRASVRGVETNDLFPSWDSHHQCTHRVCTVYIRFPSFLFSSLPRLLLHAGDWASDGAQHCVPTTSSPHDCDQFHIRLYFLLSPASSSTQATGRPCAASSSRQLACLCAWRRRPASRLQGCSASCTRDPWRACRRQTRTSRRYEPCRW